MLDKAQNFLAKSQETTKKIANFQSPTQFPKPFPIRHAGYTPHYNNRDKKYRKVCDI